MQTKKIITFGEVLMRLSPPNKRKFRQTKTVDIFFGGSEMNVAASLANFGENTQHITNVSNDFLGDAAIRSMLELGIEVSLVKKLNHPLGTYFLEVGAGMRSSKIVYNRLNSAFSNFEPEMINWEDALTDVKCFHWSGISPGISKGVYLTLLQGLSVARRKGITITADPSYRSNLWKYDMDSSNILRDLVSASTIFIGGVNEINEIFSTSFAFDSKGFIAASKMLLKECPNIERVFDKVRIGKGVSDQTIFSQAWDGKRYIRTEEFTITEVIDRIGTGDAFAAGIIYGLFHFNDEKTLAFGNAACALKHTILGDVNLLESEDVLAVLEGRRDGRIQR